MIYLERCTRFIFARSLVIAMFGMLHADDQLQTSQYSTELGFSKHLFDENYEPKATLLQLLDLAGMEPLNASEPAILQINEWAQKNFLRQGERWEAQTNRFEVLKLEIKPLLSELGFVDAVAPHFKDYQGALLQGGLLPRVRLRLHYLVEQWNQDVRFTHLYFLSGERTLEPQQESETALMQDEGSPLKIRKDWVKPTVFPKTECEMMQLVWEQSDIPEAMRREVEVSFINAPMKKDPQSEKLLRPTANDTAVYWLKVAPPYGRYLAVINSPYIHREDLVLRFTAPKEYSFDTVGSAAREQEKVIIFLDELARSIFQVKQAFTAEVLLKK